MNPIPAEALARALYVAGASIFGALGSMHLFYTLFTRRLDPRDAATSRAMQSTAPRLTAATDIWRCWIGFNASHSLGALLFAAIYLLLAVHHMDVLRASPALAWLAPAAGTAYVALAYRYWFHIPRNGILLATACFVAGASLVGH